MEKLLNKIKDIPAFQELITLGGQIYLVGGCVRDFYLGKDSKDIDIIVRLIESNQLLTILKKYGKVDLVGQTFGVIKFTPKGWTNEPFDIALPRKDILVDKTKGHQGIRAEFDHMLTIEDDINRRDFTCNSIALSWDGQVIDPHGGQQDIKNRIIRATSNSTFLEDALRQMRAIQFASRFDFKISNTTWKLIKSSKQDIQSITGERILEELEKIYERGNIMYGLYLLVSSGLHKEIFNFELNVEHCKKINIVTKADFYYVVCGGDPEVYREKLRGELKVMNGIRAVVKCNEVPENALLGDKRLAFYEGLKMSSSVLGSKTIPEYMYGIQQEFTDNKYPKSLKELAINGDDLLALGYEGAEIGKLLTGCIKGIFFDNFINQRENLLSIINKPIIYKDKNGWLVEEYFDGKIKEIKTILIENHIQGSMYFKIK